LKNYERNITNKLLLSNLEKIKFARPGFLKFDENDEVKSGSDIISCIGF